MALPNKWRPTARSLTAPDEPPGKTQLKFPNGIQYKRAMQRWHHEILSPGQKKNGYIEEWHNDAWLGQADRDDATQNKCL